MAKKKLYTIDIDTMTGDVTIDKTSKNTLDFGSKTWAQAVEGLFSEEGSNDLVIQTTNAHNYKIILKDYFAKNGKHSIKYFNTTGTSESDIAILDIVNRENITGAAQIMTQSKNGKFTGTVFNDTITGGIAAEKIYGNGGNDTIDGKGGNDAITGGAGTNTILLWTGAPFGNDTVTLTKGEHLRLKLADATDMSKVTSEIKGKDLVITVNKGMDKESSVTIKNYTRKDVLTSAGSFTLVDQNDAELYDFREDFSNIVDMDAQHYNKTSYTGTWIDDDVDASKFVAKDKKGNPITTNTDTTKGVTINLGGASYGNSAEGSIYADTIKGGADDDAIRGGKGNDVITGGAGRNYIYYAKGDGHDTVNLTKGEQFNLVLEDIDLSDVRVEYTNKQKDVKVSYVDENGAEAGSVTLKNLGKKDVTNNSTKKNPVDTSEVNLIIGDDYAHPINLRDTFVNTTIDKSNFTGGWLKDYIDASESEELLKKGKHANMVLNGGKGNDEIYGSQYADTLKGGDGDDVLVGNKGDDSIYGEGGNNEIQFYSGDGKDIVYSGKGEDTLHFVGENNIQDLVTYDLDKNGKDLIIKYGMDRTSSITVKDYIKNGTENPKCSVKYVQYSDGERIKLKDAINYQPEAGVVVEGSGDIKAVSNTEYVIGSANDDNVDLTSSTQPDVSVYAGEGDNTVTGKTTGFTNYNITSGTGDDTITTGKGTDIIDAGAGHNTITTGAGKKTITVGDSTDTEGNIGSAITLAGNNQGSVISSGGGDDTIKVANDDNYASGVTIDAGDGDNTIILGNESYYSENMNVQTGSGDDKITLIKANGKNNKIDAGDGHNIISASGYDIDVKTGSGIDEITTYGNVAIDSGAGNDIIDIMSDNSSTITAGEGDDIIDFHGNVAFGVINFNVGDGHDTLKNINNANNYLINIDDPEVDYYARHCQTEGKDRDLEIVLVKDGVETGDILTIEEFWNPGYESDADVRSTSIYINKKDNFYGDPGYGQVVGNGQFHIPVRIADGITGTNESELIYGTSGDDTIDAKQGWDVIRPGKGNDYVDVSKNNTSRVFWNQGDGNLTLKVKSDSSTHCAVYTDDYEFESMAKNGKNLVITRSNNETLTFENYFESDNSFYMGAAYIYDSETLKKVYHVHELLSEFDIDITPDADGTIWATRYAKSCNIITNEQANTIKLPCSAGTYVINGGDATAEGALADVIDISHWGSGFADLGPFTNKYEGDDLVLKCKVDYEGEWTPDNTIEIRIKNYLTQPNTVNTMHFYNDQNRTLSKECRVLSYYTNEDEDKNLEGNWVSDYIESANDSVHLNNLTANLGDGDDEFRTRGDVYTHTVENLTVDAGKGNDTVRSYTTSAQIDGGDGDDHIYAYVTTNSSLYGGSGNDYVEGHHGTEGTRSTGKLYMEGNGGEDWIYGGNNDDVIYGDNNPATNPDNKDDGADSIQGNKGNDEIHGGGGDDWIHGDEGDDTIYGDAGDDHLHGNAGNDTIYGGDGDDTIYGGQQGGTVLEEGYTDTMYGGKGTDHIHGTSSTNHIWGGKDNDNLYGLTDSKDYFHFNLGDGNDNIVEAGVVGGQVDDIVIHGYEAYTPSFDDIELELSGEGYNGRRDLYIKYNKNGEGIPQDTITIYEYIMDGAVNSSVEWIKLESTHSQAIERRIEDLWNDKMATDPKYTTTITSGNRTINMTPFNDKVNIENPTEYTISNVKLYGGTGNDTITAYGINHTLNGDAGDDTINVYAEGTTANGGAGDDTINIYADGVTANGGDGVDSFDILADNSVLNGGAGDDGFQSSDIYHNYTNTTYVFSDNGGHDSIRTSRSSGPVSYIKFEGFELSETNMYSFEITDNNKSLLIKYANSGDDPTEEGYEYPNSIKLISYLEDPFKDSYEFNQLLGASDDIEHANPEYTIRNLFHPLTDFRSAQSGRTMPVGTYLNDVAYGSAYNDTYQGGYGENAYHVDSVEVDEKWRGGQDYIAQKSGQDTVKFDHYDLNDLTISRVGGEGSDSNRLKIAYGTDGDFVTAKIHDNIQKDVIKVTDKDGDTKTIFYSMQADNTGNFKGTTGDDIFLGTTWGNSTITADKGDDEIHLNYGGNTYKFNKGDGNDVIIDETTKPDTNSSTVYMNDISLDDTNFERTGVYDLVIHYGWDNELGDYQDSVTVKDFFNKTTVDKIFIDDEWKDIISDTGNIHRVTATADYTGTTILNDYITIGANNITVSGGYRGANTYVVSKNTTATINALSSSDKIVLDGWTLGSYTLTESGDDIVFTQTADSVVLTFKNALDPNNTTVRDLTFYNSEGKLSTLDTYMNGKNFFVYDNPSIEGSINADYVRGGADSNTIYAYAGADKIIGGGAGDVIYGGDGDDVIYGDGTTYPAQTDGNDTIYGGDGDDEIYTGGGDDHVYGGLGNDTIYATDGVNTIHFALTNGAEYAQSNGQDIVQFARDGGNILKFDDATFNNISWSVQQTSNDSPEFYVNYGTGTDKVTVRNLINRVDTMVLEDADENTKTVRYSNATDGDDIFIVSSANAAIDGKGGDDFYIFRKGAGNTILENYTTGSGVINLDSGIDLEDTNFSKDGYNLVIQYNWDEGESVYKDSITVKDYFRAGRTLANIKFGTGEVIAINSENGNIHRETVTGDFVGSSLNDYITVSKETNNNSIEGGEGYNTYVVTSDDTNRHVISATSNHDTLYFDDDFDVFKLEANRNGTDIEIKAAPATGKTFEFVINDAFINDYNLTITNKNGDTTTLHNVIASAGYIQTNENYTGTPANETVVATKNAVITGMGGYDDLTLGHGGTVYTYQNAVYAYNNKGPADGKSASVQAYGNNWNTVWAQTETTNIYSYGAGRDDYHAYSDYTTNITDNGGDNDTLTFTNSWKEESGSGWVETQDGALWKGDPSERNLYLMFNVNADFDKTEDKMNVMIATKTNSVDWTDGSNWNDGYVYFDGVTINDNAVETINTTDGYSITSADLANLAQIAAAWLTDGGRDYASVEALMKTTSTDKDLFVGYVQSQADTYWQVPTP